LKEDIIYIQMLDMISSLHTTYEVSDLVIDKSKSHLVMAVFLSIALLQLSKFCPQPYNNNQLTTIIIKLITQISDSKYHFDIANLNHRTQNLSAAKTGKETIGNEES
jgi:hypothetical protein